MVSAAFSNPPSGLLISWAKEDDKRPKLTKRSRSAKRRSASRWASIASIMLLKLCNSGANAESVLAMSSTGICCGATSLAPIRPVSSSTGLRSRATTQYPVRAKSRVATELAARSARDVERRCAKRSLTSSSVSKLPTSRPCTNNGSTMRTEFLPSLAVTSCTGTASSRSASNSKSIGARVGSDEARTLPRSSATAENRIRAPAPPDPARSRAS